MSSLIALGVYELSKIPSGKQSCLDRTMTHVFCEHGKILLVTTCHLVLSQSLKGWESFFRFYKLYFSTFSLDDQLIVLKMIISFAVDPF